MSAASQGRRRLGIGLVGLGRLGRVYARDLSTRIAGTRLVAVADVDRSAVDRITTEFDVARGTTDPGEVIDDHLTIACGEGAIRLIELQREGKARMQAADFLRGVPLKTGAKFTCRCHTPRRRGIQYAEASRSNG